MKFLDGDPIKDESLRYIECPSEECMKEILEKLERLGWMWASGTLPTKSNPYGFWKKGKEKLFLILDKWITYSFECDSVIGCKKLDVVWDKTTVKLNSDVYCSCSNPIKKKSTTSIGGGGTEFFICLTCKKEV